MRKISIAAALLVAGAAAPAGAVVAVAVPGSEVAGYATPVVVAAVGGPLQFVNTDPIAVHNLVADGLYGPKTKDWCTTRQKQDDTCPLFWSATIGVGTTAVLGLDELERGGSYPFVCTIHPSTMKGTLVAV